MDFAILQGEKKITWFENYWLVFFVGRIEHQYSNKWMMDLIELRAMIIQLILIYHAYF